MAVQHGGTDVPIEIADHLTISASYRRYMLTVLMLIFVVNYVDRQIINILAEPIKQDLGLKDWQVGIMSGLAFSALYSIVGIPIALYADRANRVKILSGALAFWSIMTAVCGLSVGFVQLLLARVGVGLGEAACMPPSQSFISDITPRSRRARALSVFALGLPIGSLIAMSVGGLIAERAGWRAAFLIIGAPGLLLALLAILTLREPRSLMKAGSPPIPQRSVAASFADLKANPVFWLVTAGAATMGLVYSGLLAFLASFFLRVHGAEVTALTVTLAQSVGLKLGDMGLLGLALGCLVGGAGIVGTLLGGQVADRFARGEARGYIRVLAFVLPLLVVFLELALSRTSAVTAYLLLIPGMILMNMWLAPVFATINSIVHPANRSFAVSVHQAIVTLLGTGVGPLVVGLSSDIAAGFSGEGAASGLRIGMMATCLLALVAALIFWVAAKHGGALAANNISPEPPALPVKESMQ